ncbi:MAG: UvrD-helicase domain-containing protein [Candidatus Roizmanbacteria bacterium]|nr:MAG: UvrD-helicase domain-containing protein [Candidatus Roizmanbacteria bacterium]
MQLAPNNLLNDEQKKAVAVNSGPLLIIAGAGTGKTTVIIEKIKDIIANKLAKPDEILALTFTEKASAEMEERVDREMPYGYFQMWISTFHSFADQILRDEISHIGLNAGYKLLTQAETIMFLKNNLFLFNLKYFRPLGNPHKFLGAMLQHFSRLRDEDISPEQYLTWVNNKPHNSDLSEEEKEKILELANAYKTYQELKIKEGFFDFSDLIFYLLKLFRSRLSILKKYQQQFKYVLVDEFQDTNIAQYLLLKLLCPTDSNPNLTVVGDDSQAIYKFRGASISNILTFMKDYPQAMQVTLKTNYRSYQHILDSSYKLIQNNNPDTLETQLGISKRLTAQRGQNKTTVQFYGADNINRESEFVSREIIKLKQKKNYKYSNFALLVRANNHADPFVAEFIRQGIPYKFFGPGMLFKQPEVKDLIAYLKVLYNIEDSISLYRVLSMDIFNIDTRDINLLITFSKKTNLPLLLAIEVYLFLISVIPIRQSSTLRGSDPNGLAEKESNAEIASAMPRNDNLQIYKKFLPLLHEDTKVALDKIYKMIHRHLELVKKDSAGQILYYFLEDTGYIKQIVTYQSQKQEKIALNISKFFSKLKSYENGHSDASVYAVVDYLDMSMEVGESPIVAEDDVADYDAVNIMTAHAAKGLEFPIVFLVNLSRGRFPTYEKKEPIPIPNELIKEILPQGDYHMQEERRLFYVGMTRAKDNLYLSLSQSYGEGKRERKISPFVIEALGEDIMKQIESKKKEEKLQLSIFDFKKPEENIIKEKFMLTNFSFSQLECFDKCPLQYKYQYILKIPTLSSSAASFGDTIHKTLQRFYQEYINDKKIGLPRLREIYHEQWVPIGYASAEHQEKMKQEGEKIIDEYFKNYHNPDIEIMALEKLFKIKLVDDIFLTGKIDRVDKTENGGIEIIDYKTGSMPDDKELAKSLQLSIYALAATDKGLYGKKLEQVGLAFYYLKDMQKKLIKRTDEDMSEVKNEIVEIVTKIRSDDFKPKVSALCSFCSFKMICEAW